MHSYLVSLAHGRSLVLGPRTLVMGVINVTPDSFSDGGRFVDVDAAVEAGRRMLADGADVLDIGGETTKPGAAAVGADEELRRVIPVVAALAREPGAIISIDTYKAAVGRAAIDAGAVLINDISGLQYDPALAQVAAATHAGLILMHMRGRSSDMYGAATYDDIVGEVAHELSVAMARADAAGVPREAIVLDPGLGFAKRAEQSLTLLACLDAPALVALGRPWLVGPSRKSFLTRAIGDVPPAGRDWATAAAVTASVLAGAHIVRVHRVAEMVQVVRVADTIRAARAGGQPSGPPPAG
jgi:dihydropteroate synthase